MRRGSVIAMLVAALIVVGCGGDDGGSGTDETVAVTTSEELTKGELIAKGDDICDETDEVQEEKLQSYLKKHPNSQSSKKGQADLVREAGLPPIQAELEELAALGAPPGDEEKIEAILRGIERAIEKGEDDPTSLLAEGSLSESVGKLAADYGFRACQNPL